MKWLLIGAVMIAPMADQLVAQGGMQTGGAPQSPAYTLGSVMAAPVGDAVPAVVISNPRRWFPPAGRSEPSGFADWRNRPPCADRPELCRHGDIGFSDSGYASDPAFYPHNYVEPIQFLPSVIVVIPVIQRQNAPSPPAPAVETSDINEYDWPASGADSTATTYFIVSKDGSVISTAAVWVQDNALCYYTPEHSTGRIPIGSIDRKATRQRNAERQLSFWLPPENQR